MYNCLHVGVKTDDLKVLKDALGDYIMKSGGIKVQILPDDPSQPDVPKEIQEALTNVVIEAIKALVCQEFDALQ